MQQSTARVCRRMLPFRRLVHTEAKLAALGFTLPKMPMPLGVYVPCVRTGNLVHTAGHIFFEDPLDVKTLKVGKVGVEYTVEDATKIAEGIGLELLATLQHACDGDLDRVKRIVKVVGRVLESNTTTMPASRLPFVIPAAVLVGVLLVELQFDLGAEDGELIGYYRCMLPSPLTEAILPFLLVLMLAALLHRLSTAPSWQANACTVMFAIGAPFFEFSVKAAERRMVEEYSAVDAMTVRNGHLVLFCFLLTAITLVCFAPDNALDSTHDEQDPHEPDELTALAKKQEKRGKDL